MLSSRRVRWSLPPQRRVAHLESGVLRQHDAREREDLAGARGRATSLSVPHPERLQRAVPDHEAGDGRPGSAAGVGRLPFRQIGAEGGFLPAPIELDRLLIAPAERADVIVDFSGLPIGTALYLINEGPDEPPGGGSLLATSRTQPRPARS